MKNKTLTIGWNIMYSFQLEASIVFIYLGKPFSAVGAFGGSTGLHRD